MVVLLCGSAHLHWLADSWSSAAVQYLTIDFWSLDHPEPVSGPAGYVSLLPGKLTLNIDPRPGSEVMLSEPRLRSNICLQSTRPSPVPFSPDVPSVEWVLLAARSCLTRPGDIPRPVSRTSHWTTSPSAKRAIETEPPGGVNLSALETRF